MDGESGGVKSGVVAKLAAPLLQALPLCEGECVGVSSWRRSSAVTLRKLLCIYAEGFTKLMTKSFQQLGSLFDVSYTHP